ncbi:hypothetical protein ACTGJ9_039160 [Bradyrhizobium sp. RDM12]
MLNFTAGTDPEPLKKDLRISRALKLSQGIRMDRRRRSVDGCQRKASSALDDERRQVLLKKLIKDPAGAKEIAEVL